MQAPAFMARMAQVMRESVGEKAPRAKPKLVAEFVTTPKALKKAQRLRAKVFGEEYGLKFKNPVKPLRRDRDAFDDFCVHLNVYDEANGHKLVATTRLLSSEQARLAGGFYSAGEFDMSAVEKLPGRVLELGRTCVHPNYRSGGAITILWSALAEYLMAEGFSYLVGCASISLRDGGHNFASIMPELRAKHFVDSELRVSPLRGLNIESPANTSSIAMPPLLKAYLRMGCKIGGEACWDPDFNCADVFVILDVASLSSRYAQRFLKAS